MALASPIARANKVTLSTFRCAVLPTMGPLRLADESF
jgi:hypothetical protein